MFIPSEPQLAKGITSDADNCRTTFLLATSCVTRKVDRRQIR